MKHTNDVNDVEEGQNVNTLSEIEEYYKAREQQLLKKLHQQGAALAAAEQALKQLTENQKVSEDETARQRAAREQQLKDELYRDPLTGIYNRRYYEEVARKTIGPAGIALMDVDDFKICNDTYGHYAGDMALKTVANTIQLLHPERRTCSSAMAEMNFCWCYPAFRETFCRPNWNRSAPPRRWHLYPAIRISVSR